MKIAIIFAAVAVGLYLVFSQGSNITSALTGQRPILTTGSTPGVLNGTAVVGAGYSNAPGGYYASPSPVIAAASLATAGANVTSAIVNAFNQNPAPGNIGVGVTTGPTYAQAGISPDLPLTPSSPSLLVSLNGSPAVIDSSIASDLIDYPGIQTYMTDPTAPDPNAYDGTGGAVYT